MSAAGLWPRIERLTRFRFVPAIGGIANDGDQLLVALRCDSLDDLAELLRALELPCREHEGQPEQPGHCKLRGLPVFGWAHRDGDGWRLELSPVDAEHPYDVTERCVAAAEAIEPWLEPWADRVVRR